MDEVEFRFKDLTKPAPLTREASTMPDAAASVTPHPTLAAKSCLRFVQHRTDPQEPVYELNMAAGTYRLISTRSFTGRCVPDVSGKLRKPSDFTGPQWKEVRA